MSGSAEAAHLPRAVAPDVPGREVELTSVYNLSPRHKLTSGYPGAPKLAQMHAAYHKQLNSMAGAERAYDKAYSYHGAAPPPPPELSRSRPPAPRRAWGGSGDVAAPGAFGPPEGEAKDVLANRALSPKHRELDPRALVAAVPTLQSLQTPWQPDPKSLSYRHYKALQKHRGKQEKMLAAQEVVPLPPI